MKRILLSLLALLFPWIVILLEGRFIAAMACLALQLTFVGWIPATIWAFKTLKKLQLPENNDIDTTQSSEKTQVENAQPPSTSPTSTTENQPSNPQDNPQKVETKE